MKCKYSAGLYRLDLNLSINLYDISSFVQHLRYIKNLKTNFNLKLHLITSINGLGGMELVNVWFFQTNRRAYRLYHLQKIANANTSIIFQHQIYFV